jgi:hypothetical protein
MAATYRHIHARAAKAAAARSAGHTRLRNRLTGALIIGAVIVLAVWGSGGGLGRLPPTRKLRQVGLSPEGHPIYSPI